MGRIFAGNRVQFFISLSIFCDDRGPGEILVDPFPVLSWVFGSSDFSLHAVVSEDSTATM